MCPWSFHSVCRGLNQYFKCTFWENVHSKIKPDYRNQKSIHGRFKSSSLGASPRVQCYITSLYDSVFSTTVCCSVLQCVAVCCSVLPCFAVCCSGLQCVAVCCSVLQCGVSPRVQSYIISLCRLQPSADRLAQNFEIISKTLSTYQNSAHGIYDVYQVITWCPRVVLN